MDKQLPPQQINQEIKDVVNQMFGDMFDSKPKPQPQPAEVFRSQPISGFFFPRKDPYDDWGLSAEEATRRAEDLMEQHVHKEAEVLSMLMYAAFRGHPRAMYRLGMAFYTGSQEIVDKVLAEHWLRRCAKLGGECSAQAEAFVRTVSGFEHLQIRGFMTIAPYVEDPELNRVHFRALRNLAVDIGRKNIANVMVNELSMGMTGDFEVAIEEGATLVRVGTGIFGERNYNI
jgi:hypothetical protein